MNTISIRKVKSEESEQLAQLGRETFYETWREVNTEEDMQAYLSIAFDEEKILKELQEESVNTFLFAFDNDLLVGYAKVRNDLTYDEFAGSRTLEIERIYVRKEYQGKLAGKMLMDSCLEIGKNEKYDWIWLGVNIDNHRAIAFYKKYNFTVFGTKMFKLGEAEDQDFLMKLRLSGE